MAIPKIYYDTVKKKWIVENKDGNFGVICFGNCNSLSTSNGSGLLPDGEIGVFGGGSQNYYKIYFIIDYITISTPGNAQNFGSLTERKRELAATSNGTNNRGVFGGGTKNTSGWDNYDISAIDYIVMFTPCDATNFGNLSVARDGLAATSNGINDRGVFGGGDKGEKMYVDIMDYITISTPGNAQNFGNLTVARQFLAATSNGRYGRGVFGGGEREKREKIKIIEYITISTPGNAKNFGNLTVARLGLAATSNGTHNRGVFGGAKIDNKISTIEYITISTPGDAQSFGNLTVAREYLAATSNGTNDRGVFGGGSINFSDKIYNNIDYITISTPGNAQNFGNLTVARENLAATSNG